MSLPFLCNFQTVSSNDMTRNKKKNVTNFRITEQLLKAGNYGNIHVRDSKNCLFIKNIDTEDMYTHTDTISDMARPYR